MLAALGLFAACSSYEFLAACNIRVEGAGEPLMGGPGPGPAAAVQVTGLAVSPRHPYMFSCGLDKMVKCWDLEQNKVSQGRAA